MPALKILTDEEGGGYLLRTCFRDLKEEQLDESVQRRHSGLSTLCALKQREKEKTPDQNLNRVWNNHSRIILQV